MQVTEELVQNHVEQNGPHCDGGSAALKTVHDVSGQSLVDPKSPQCASHDPMRDRIKCLSKIKRRYVVRHTGLLVTLDKSLESHDVGQGPVKGSKAVLRTVKGEGRKTSG